MDGSVFWPAPQSAWGWPPPVEIDPTPSGNYQYQYSLDVDQASKSFTLTSGVSDALSLQMSKRISMDPDSGAVVLDFAMRNTGWQARSWAPWEVTRVGPNGLTFYATGSLPPTSGTWPALPCHGGRWRNLVPAQKLIFSGEALCRHQRGLARAHGRRARHGEVLRKDPHICSRAGRTANRDLRQRLVRRGGGAGRL